MLSSLVCCGSSKKKKASTAGGEEADNKGEAQANKAEVTTPQMPTEEAKTQQTPTEEPKTRKSVAQMARLRQSVVKGGAESMTVEQNMKAGYQAVDDHARSGFVIGVSSGAFSENAIQRLRKKLEAGELKNITLVPMSARAEELAAAAAIPLGTLNTHPEVDLVIDEADEVDDALNLTKGSSGLVLREKMVARKAKKKIIVVDATKLSDCLGTQLVPVEIVPFCHEHTMRKLEQLSAFQGCGCEAKLRHSSVEKNKEDSITITENGNYIVDLKLKNQMQDAAAAAEQLTRTVGVVEHGLFIQMVDCVIVSSPPTKENPEGISLIEPGDTLV